MDKRTFQALLVCFAISILYMNLFMAPQEQSPGGNEPVANPTGITEQVAGDLQGSETAGNIPSQGSGATQGNTDSSATLTAPVQPPAEVKTVSLTNGMLDLVLSSRGALLTEVRLPEYKESLEDQEPLSLLSPALKSAGALGLRIPAMQLDLSRVNWEVVAEDAGSVRFQTAIDAERQVVHSITLPAEGYELTSKVEFLGNWSTTNELYYEILGAERIRFESSGRATAYPNQWVAAQRNQDGSIKEAVHESVEALEGGEQRKSNIAWGGLESTYFAQVIRPLGERETGSLVIRGKEPGVDEALFNQYEDDGLQGWPLRVGFNRLIDPTADHSYAVFLGPKDPEVLSQNASWDAMQLIDYGFFGWLCRPFLALLRFFDSFFGSWGLAIIALTFVIRAVLHPVNKRNQRQMQVQQQGMARIKPQMDEIRERFKNDPTTMHRKTQELFKQEGVNPAAMFGGCLFIFLQLPIWIALINTFSVAIELRQTAFLWIGDLTQPDMLFQMPFALPLLGDWFNLLPLIYVVVTLINQRMMPKSEDPQAQAQQKMMAFMMIAFGFIFYSFASGLLIYFIISALVGIGEQKLIRKELAAAGITPGVAQVAVPSGPATPAPPKGPGRPGKKKS
ncbi:MAG: YidC/Oxa1 family insertase periplasmic-domain containing protein [Planctomycetota bacterium]